MAVRPYLETRKYQYTDLKKVENRGNTWFLDVKNGKTTYQAEIPEEIQEIKKRIQRMENGPNANPYLEVSADYASDSYLANHYLLEIEICNCGAGNAIDVEFEMNGHSLAPIFCITTDLPKKFICILNEDLLVNGEYEMLLSYKYGDISSSAKYVQKEKVIFYRDNSNELSTKQYKSDYLTRPVEITDVKS